jgi:hypothetical protein
MKEITSEDVQTLTLISAARVTISEAIARGGCSVTATITPLENELILNLSLR